MSLIINGLGDMSAARPLAEESAAIYRKLSDQRGLAEAGDFGGGVGREILGEVGGVEAVEHPVHHSGEPRIVERRLRHAGDRTR
jgi:hypothetical protein